MAAHESAAVGFIRLWPAAAAYALVTLEGSAESLLLRIWEAPELSPCAGCAPALRLGSADGAGVAGPLRFSPD